jgi:uncharacterized membrane protein
MQIDTQAPVQAHETILIHAPIEKVWAIQSDLENWPSWQADVQSIQLDGELKEGTVFRWKAQGLTSTSILKVVAPPNQIGWTGNSMGMKAVHIWHFEATPDGTKVTTEESLSGWLTRLLALFDKNFLQKSMAKSLTTLKERVESTT